MPESDAAAATAYVDLMEAMESAVPGTSIEPTPRIQAYVEALLARWPDIDVDEDSPWASAPLMGEASGSLVYFPMIFSRADEASEFAARVAGEHGLVCFDPQLERLRP